MPVGLALTLKPLWLLRYVYGENVNQFKGELCAEFHTNASIIFLSLHIMCCVWAKQIVNKRHTIEFTLCLQRNGKRGMESKMKQTQVEWKGTHERIYIYTYKYIQYTYILQASNRY